MSPSEVEERLLEHPDVAEVAVVAAPDESGLDKPVACVVPHSGHIVDADTLIGWCHEGLAAFKRPRTVAEMAELPKTATGKIRRNILREHVAEVLVVSSTRWPTASQPYLACGLLLSAARGPRAPPRTATGTSPCITGAPSTRTTGAPSDGREKFPAAARTGLPPHRALRAWSPISCGLQPAGNIPQHQL